MNENGEIPIFFDSHSINIFGGDIAEAKNEFFETKCRKMEESLKTKQKRGRKPKGGKIKTKEPENQKETKIITNVILHLKCSTIELNKYNSNITNLSLNLLEYNPNIPPDIMTYNNENSSSLRSEKINNGINNLYSFESEDDTYITNNLNGTPAFTNWQTLQKTKDVLPKNTPAYQPYLHNKFSSLPSRATEEALNSSEQSEEKMNICFDKSLFNGKNDSPLFSISDSIDGGIDENIINLHSQATEKPSNYSNASTKNVKTSSSLCTDEKLTFLTEASPEVNRMFSKQSAEKLCGFSVDCEGEGKMKIRTNSISSCFHYDEILEVEEHDSPFLAKTTEKLSNFSEQSVDEKELCGFSVACEGKLAEASPEVNRMFSEQNVEKLSVACEGKSNHTVNTYSSLITTEEENIKKMNFDEGVAVSKELFGTKGKKNETTDKELNLKIKKLKIGLYKNTKQNQKSACFWCTHDFDNPSCYIPKYENDKSVVGYGSFCTPECASAFLMNESLDDSTKFERYHLLNKVYAKIYNYSKNIKPAPNPFYLLEKYYGNMTIQEYRKILKSGRTFIVLEKPFTRFLPELHEDNEDIILNYNSNCKEIMEDRHYVKNHLETRKVSGFENFASSPFCEDKNKNKEMEKTFRNEKNGNMSSLPTEEGYSHLHLTSYSMQPNGFLSGRSIDDCFGNGEQFVNINLPSQATVNSFSSTLRFDEKININNINRSGNYKVKKQTEHAVEMSKTNIMKQLFA